MPERLSTTGFLRALCLLVLLGMPGAVVAEWTGVEVEIGDLEVDWEFSDDVRQAKSNSLFLRIEERIQSGLAVGAGIGYYSLRLDAFDGGDKIKFEAYALEFYLRQEFQMNETLSIEPLLSYSLNDGRENSSADDRADLDWSQVTFELGLPIRLSNWRITPYVNYSSVDGDTSGVEQGGSFELEDPFSQGVRFDIFTESTAFIRIELQSGSQTGGYLSFVRRY